MDIVGAKKGAKIKSGSALTGAMADIGVTDEGHLLLQLKFKTREQAEKAAKLLTGEEVK